MCSGPTSWGSRAAATRAQLIAGVRVAMEQRCGCIEELLSGSVPSAPDGAIFPELSVSIADGEPPRAIRLRYPGFFEQPVPLWDCLDRAALWDCREELLARSRETERLSRDAAGYLYAAGALRGELVSVSAAAMDRGKLLAYARRLAAREFPRPSGSRGREKVRFLSAVTGEGRVLLRDTIAAAAPRVIAIEDNWGAVGDALLETLRELALGSGTEVVTCRCPLFPFTKIDHLLLPRLGLGFVTVNRATAPVLSGLPERTIHAGRFTDPDLPRRHRARGRFLRKAVSGMLDQAATVLGQAAAAQRGVDEILLAGTHRDRVEEMTERVIREISAP